MATKDISIRIGRDEIARIMNLKEHLDHYEAVQSYAAHYLRLGWALEAIKATEGTSLDLDFGQPPEVWSRRLNDLSMAGVQANLTVRTGRASRLLVLEVNQGEGALSLDQLGDWRAECIAVMGDHREQHYYVLPSERPSPPSFFQAPQVLIYGEGGLVLAPPSLESQAQESWRWLQPPWEKAPEYPKPAVWEFLKHQVPLAAGEPQVPTWAEIYRVISPYGIMLKSLLTPATSPEAYYRGILQAALGVGLKEPAFLLGLLWHAPHGEARHRADRSDYLQELVDQALELHLGKSQTADLPATLADTGARALTAAPGAELETASPTERLAQDSLSLIGNQGSTTEPATPRFDQSVSGQFFQLLAGLGEKVIMESCRYEALLAGLGPRTGELESLVADWERCFNSAAPASAGGNPGVGKKGEPDPIEFQWTSVANPQAQRMQQLAEVQAAAGDFLERNPDLAADQSRIQMVLFCLKNYISINPEFARLPFREKLERAGIMARGFLREQGEA